MNKPLALLALVLNFLLIAAHASPAKLSHIEGIYHCKGYDPFAKVPYEGKLNIKKTGDTYAFFSNYGKNATYQGIGIYDSSHHSISAAFINPSLPEESGAAIVHIKKDGSLKTTWTYMKEKITGSSQCEKV